MSANSMKKCPGCNKIMLFEQRTVPYNGKRYHERCFKSLKRKQNEFQKRTSFKPETVSRPISLSISSSGGQNWGVARLITSASLQKCAYCDEFISFKDESIEYYHQWYHEQCLTPFKIIEEKKQQEKTIIDFKTKTISKPVVVAKKKFDPVITGLTIAIFFVIYLTTLLLFSNFVLISVGLAAAFVSFQLYTARRALHSKYKYGKRLPSSFAFFMLILPFIFGILLIIEGQAIWESYSRMIILGGLTITFLEYNVICANCSI